MIEAPARRKDIPPQRRREILDAAAELFSQRGYHGVTVNAIAERAGISKGNLYWYFTSKQEVFYELFEYVAIPLFAPVVEILFEDGAPREKLVRVARACFDTAEANPEAVRLVWQIAAQPELRELTSSEYTNWGRPFLELVVPQFVAMGDPRPEDAALFYAITLDALMAAWAMSPEVFDRDKVLAILEERVIDFGRPRDV
jgi:AcrR family transcriptional regulator